MYDGVQKVAHLFRVVLQLTQAVYSDCFLH